MGKIQETFNIKSLSGVFEETRNSSLHVNMLCTMRNKRFSIQQCHSFIVEMDQQTGKLGHQSFCYFSKKYFLTTISTQAFSQLMNKCFGRISFSMYKLNLSAIMPHFFIANTHTHVLFKYRSGKCGIH